MQPRDELARAERLGDVVVRAGLQRADLVVLVADRGEHEDRHLAPLARRAADLDAVAVGQDEVEDRRVRALQRRDVQRLGGGLRRQRLEAGLAHHDLQRAHDLRLVVADEHALRRRSRQTRLAGRAVRPRLGSGTDEARPLTGQRLGPHAAAVGLDEPLDDRQPEARAGMARGWPGAR